MSGYEMYYIQCSFCSWKGCLCLWEELSFSPSAIHMCTQKKESKAKTQKDKLLKMLWSLYVTLNHCVQCSKCKQPWGDHGSCPSHVIVWKCLCVWLKSSVTCVFVISTCAVVKKIILIPFWDNGQNPHITLCSQTPIKPTALFLYTVPHKNLLSYITTLTSKTLWTLNNNFHLLFYRMVHGTWT